MVSYRSTDQFPSARALMGEIRKDSFEVFLSCNVEKIFRYQIFWMASSLDENIQLHNLEFKLDPFVQNSERFIFKP